MSSPKRYRRKTRHDDAFKLALSDISDIRKMIAAHEQCGLRLVQQVHDELIFEEAEMPRDPARCAFYCRRRVQAPQVACKAHWDEIGARWRTLITESFGTPRFEEFIMAAANTLREAKGDSKRDHPRRT